MMDFMRDFWGIILALVGGIAWLVRLESRGVANAEEIKRLWNQRREDMDTAKEGRARVDKRLDEIGSDVKQLLREVKK